MFKIIGVCVGKNGFVEKPFVEKPFVEKPFVEKPFVEILRLQAVAPPSLHLA